MWGMSSSPTDTALKDYVPKFKAGDEIVFKRSIEKTTYYYTILSVCGDSPNQFYKLLWWLENDKKTADSIEASLFDRDAALIGSAEATWLIL